LLAAASGRGEKVEQDQLVVKIGLGTGRFEIVGPLNCGHMSILQTKSVGDSQGAISASSTVRTKPKNQQAIIPRLQKRTCKD
jgi:hypothetical protein